MKGVYIFFIGLLLVSSLSFAETFCETSDDCAGWEYCGSKQICTPVVGGLCGQIGNHAFIEFECCWDDECGAGEVCFNNTCQEKETKDIEALSAINQTQTAISEAQEKEWITAEAEAKLFEAQEAYENEEYKLAKSLAEEALTLIEELEAGPADENMAGEDNSGKDVVVQDFSWLFYAIIIAAILIVLSRLLAKKK